MRSQDLKIEQCVCPLSRCPYVGLAICHFDECLSVIVKTCAEYFFCGRNVTGNIAKIGTANCDSCFSIYPVLF